MRIIWLFTLTLCSLLSAAQDLEIHYIANEGVLIKTGDSQVIIDGLFKSTYADYESPSGQTMEAMMAKTGPYTSVDLVLASHIHSDHFTPNEAAKVLAELPETTFYGSETIVESLLEVNSELKDQTQSFAHSENQTKAFGDIRITSFPISHAGGSPDNSGHLIEINGFKILHVGDPDYIIDPSEVAHLKETEIDVAILPYWMLYKENYLKANQSTLEAKTYIANHIPPAEVNELTKQFQSESTVAVINKEPLIVTR